jgi:hypothetical protein
MNPQLHSIHAEKVLQIRNEACIQQQIGEARRHTFWGADDA